MTLARSVTAALLCLTMAPIGLAQQDAESNSGTPANQDDLDFLLNDPGVEDEAPPDNAQEDNESSSSGSGESSAVNSDASIEQEAASTRSVARKTSRFIEEIVVTAQKREENIRDVPVSVQAFSGEKLDAAGITEQTDLPRITPGLQLANQVAFTTIFMRGVGSDAFLTADPSVATYIDGIYFPSAIGLSQDFGKVERVEVLKGPQGTLFGRNSTGGAINIITEAPQFDGFSLSTQYTTADYPDTKSRVHVNVPIADSLAMSLSAVYNQTEHYVDARAGGEPLDDDEVRALRARVRWAPVDWMDLTISSLKYEADTPSATFAPHQETTPLGRLLLTGPGQPPRRAELDWPNHNKLDNEVVYGQLELTPGPFDIKLLGSKQDQKLNGSFDFDGSMMPLMAFYPPNNFSDSRSAELQVLSNDASWGASRLKWIMGYYYFSGKAGFDPTIGYIGAIDTDVLIPQLNLPPLLENILLDVAGLINPITSQGLARTYLQGVIDSKSHSTFAEATLSVTDWLDITLGARYQTEERFVDKSTVGLSLPGQDPLKGERITLFDWDYAQDADGNRVSLRDVTRSFNPKGVISLRPWKDETLLYFSAQRASKSSTYNAVTLTAPPTLVEPEEITAYEAGLKTSLFDGLSYLSLAAFKYDIKDLQVQYFALLNGGLVTFENVPKSVSKGYEVEFVTTLFPNLMDGLVLGLGGAYVDAVYEDFPNGSGFPEPSYLFMNDLDLSGNRMVRAPKKTANLSLSKTWQTNKGSFELAGDVYYNSGFFLETTNVSRTEQDAYKDVGIRVSYLHEPWGLRLTLFGRNITDETYVTGGLPNDFGNALFYAPPESYGLRVNWDFTP